MTDNLKTWPERIYLQHSEDNEAPNFADVFGVRDEITWCQDKQFDGDVEYVRADRVQHAQQAVESEQESLGYVLGSDAARAVGRFQQSGPVGFIAKSDPNAEIRATREQAVEDERLHITKPKQRIEDCLLCGHCAATGQKVATPQQVSEQAIRDAALEEAAQTCELWNTTPGSKLAEAIRALRSQQPAQAEGK